MKDKCILCGAETPYDQSTHIDMRVGYIEGAGQVCTACLEENKQSRRGVVIMGHDVLSHPNDADLGAMVRKTWYESI